MDAYVLGVPSSAVLMRIDEVAKVLNVSQRKVWALTQPRGPIRAVRLGKRSVRYAPDDVQRYLELCRGSLTTLSA